MLDVMVGDMSVWCLSHIPPNISIPLIKYSNFVFSHVYKDYTGHDTHQFLKL